MTNITKLTDILRELGGTASVDAITEAYCKKYHMQKLPVYKLTIANTLMKHISSGILIRDQETGMWKLLQEEDKPRKESIPVLVTTETNEDLILLNGILDGSPEWFFRQSQTDAIQERRKSIRQLRDRFVQSYAPDKLERMTSEELLIGLFSISNGMLFELTMSPAYVEFGAGSKFSYLWPLRYSAENNECTMYEKQRGRKISREEALEKAVEVRERLLYCINRVEAHRNFERIEDYKELDTELSSVSFAKYPWALKYYQMLYPEFFPGMYAAHTLTRAMKILGLPKHSQTVQKMGEVSLHTRECNVDNIIFMHLFGVRWGWDEEQPICEYAKSKLKTV